MKHGQQAAHESPQSARAADQHGSAGGVLVLDRLSKSFGSKHAVREVSFAVQPGEVFGFLGPNGAGKSTTIRMILDVLRPSAGHISLFGVDTRSPAKLVRTAHARIGYLSGDMVMDNNLTGRQYLTFVAAQYERERRRSGHHPKQQAIAGTATTSGRSVEKPFDIPARRDELAQLLQADLDVKIGHYSRGNRQKIGLIAALQHRPDLLVLDEPTSGFDPLAQERFADLITEFKAGGGAVLMSSHVLREVQELCDRVAFIKDGSILQVTEVGQLMEHSAKRVSLRVPLNQLKALHNRLKPMPGVEELLPGGRDDELLCLYSGSPNVLIRMLTAFDVQDMSIQEQELEEIFMHYYEQQMKQAPGAAHDGQPPVDPRTIPQEITS